MLVRVPLVAVAALGEGDSELRAACERALELLSGTSASTARVGAAGGYDAAPKKGTQQTRLAFPAAQKPEPAPEAAATEADEDSPPAAAPPPTTPAPPRPMLSLAPEEAAAQHAGV